MCVRLGGRGVGEQLRPGRVFDGGLRKSVTIPNPLNPVKHSVLPSDTWQECDASVENSLLGVLWRETSFNDSLVLALNIVSNYMTSSLSVFGLDIFGQL